MSDLRKDTAGFMECGHCTVKPGTPYLCQACLNNREIMHRQKAEIERLARERDEARQFARSYRESWSVNAFREVLPLTDSEPKWLYYEPKAVAEPEEREEEG